MWVRTHEEGCQSLTFAKATRGLNPWSQAGDRRKIWSTQTQDQHLDEKGWTQIQSWRDVSFDDESGMLVFASLYRESRPPRELRMLASPTSDAISGLFPVQVVAVKSDRVLVVRGGLGGNLHRYAREDVAALFFDRKTCEASPEPNFVVP